MAAGGAAAATGERRRCPIWGLASRRNAGRGRHACSGAGRAADLDAQIVVSIAAVADRRPKRRLRSPWNWQVGRAAAAGLSDFFLPGVQVQKGRNP